MQLPVVLSKINPNFFYDYAKMFGERTQANQNNFVERLLNSDEQRLKQVTDGNTVLNELEHDMNKFLAFQRGKTLEHTKLKLKGTTNQSSN